ncbi:MAG: hypothetical protein O7F08_04495 [Deltaproteobacteria bacterium]|nr:hypothetical protein [Deltaproteobacteria bacterium]
MNAKRWTFGVALAAAVSLFGLVEANASPFSMFVLSDDLGNRVNGSAPEWEEWEAPPEENAGHGNNEDGVDSGNTGQSGESLGGDESCDGSGECIDDEMDSGNAAGGEEIDVGDGAASDSQG